MMDLEEMLRELSEKYKNSKSVEVYEEQLEWWFKLIDDLREENKKLNIIIENTKIEQKSDREHIEELEEENKKLKLENAKLKDRIITDENFEERLDKENKKLKEDVDYRHHRAMVAERWWEDED